MIIVTVKTTSSPLIFHIPTGSNPRPMVYEPATLTTWLLVLGWIWSRYLVIKLGQVQRNNDW